MTQAQDIAPARAAPHPVWVLADDRPGNVNQALGVAEALGVPYRTVPIAYGPAARLPNWLRGAGLIGLDPACRTALVPPWPRLVIGAGRRCAPVARWIKRQAAGTTRLCQIMRPLAGWEDFDLVAVPAHDRVAARDNLIVVPAAPHRVWPVRLTREAARWAARLEALPRPRYGLLVGGSTRRTRFTPDMARDLATQLAAVARAAGGGVMVTTSRRTGAAAEAQIEAALAGQPHFFHRWGAAGDNPYFALLALSDAVVVTGDSVSMCSEACAAGVPVYIFAPAPLVPPRHGRLHQALYDAGSARPFEGNIEIWNTKPLNSSIIIAERLRGWLE